MGDGILTVKTILDDCRMCKVQTGLNDIIKCVFFTVPAVCATLF